MDEPAFVATANVSGNLEACAPWGITISGGSPPYTITLAETGDPFVINATMPYGADRYIYINRATSGGLLIGEHPIMYLRLYQWQPLGCRHTPSDFNALYS